MKDLIKIENTPIGDESVPTVSARELYQKLGLHKAHWSRWVKQNIKNNPFALENEDFLGFTIMVNGNVTQDFHLSLDFAKKLAMQVKTKVGEEVRDYFIQCERRATLPQTKIEAVRAYLEELEAHEATRVGGQASLTHKKEVAKLENGKSIYGASIRQVALKTGRNYSAKKLTRWCKANCRPPLVVRQDYPNGYSSAKVSVYHAEAWREVGLPEEVHLFLYFDEDELFYEETSR